MLLVEEGPKILASCRMAGACCCLKCCLDEVHLCGEEDCKIFKCVVDEEERKKERKKWKGGYIYLWGGEQSGEITASPISPCVDWLP